MPVSPCISSTLLANGDTLYYGRQLMNPPDGGADKKLRLCIFNLPELQTVSSRQPEQPNFPVILVSIDTPTGQGQGDAFGLNSVQQTSQPGLLQINIDAQSVTNQDSDMDYWCSITVIGQPVIPQVKS